MAKTKKLAHAWFEAVAESDLATMSDLLQHGVDPNLLDETGSAALHSAALFCDEAVLAHLIDAGADLDVRTDDRSGVAGRTPLMELALRGAADPPQEFHLDANSTPADLEGAMKALGGLLSGLMGEAKLDLDLDDAPPRSESPPASHELLRRLLDAGANPNLQDDEGCTALLLAVDHHDDATTARILLEGGADPNAVDLSGMSAATRARSRGHEAVAAVIEAAGGEASGSANADLQHAVVEGDLASVRDALEAGADPNHTPPYPEAALLFTAATYGHHLIVAELLGAGARVDSHPDHGCPALHGAIEVEDTRMVELLLDRGADPRIVDLYGRSAIDVAKSVGSAEILLLLGGDPDQELGLRNQRGLATPDVNEFSLLVRAPLEEVASAFAASRHALAHERDVGGREVEASEECYLAYQLDGHAWTILEALHLPPSAAGLEDADARTLSDRLHTPALNFEISDTAGAVRYHLFDSGQSTEFFSYGDSLDDEDDDDDEDTPEFRSSRRQVAANQMEESPFEFVDATLSALDAYVPGWSESARRVRRPGPARIDAFEKSDCPRIDLIRVR